MMPVSSLKYTRVIIALVIITGLVFLFGCSEQETELKSKEDRKVLYWKSPMDPAFISQQPGKDAMGEDLVPVYEGDPGTNLRTIAVSGATLQRMGLRIGSIERRRLERSIRSVATIEYNERALYIVSMKFDGWIEKLHVNETGQFVEKGDPLLEVYSPELVASGEEYVQTVAEVSDVPHMEHLLQSARKRLEQFDLSDAVIDRMRKSGVVPRSLTIYAKSRGYVVHKQAFEGTFIKTGSPLFTIADLDTVWVYVDIYEYELPWLKTVQEANMELTYVPGRIYRGVIDYVYPFLNEKSRTIKVRLVFPNPELELKPGMFATVTLRSLTPKSVVVVPSEAVIRSGKRNIVFRVVGDGRFEPQEVRLGRQGEGGDYEVLSGLSEGERIVTSGQFLLDSESRLKEAVAKMLGSSLSEEEMAPEHQDVNSASKSVSGGEDLQNQEQ